MPPISREKINEKSSDSNFGIFHPIEKQLSVKNSNQIPAWLDSEIALAQAHTQTHTHTHTHIHPEHTHTHIHPEHTHTQLLMMMTNAVCFMWHFLRLVSTSSAKDLRCFASTKLENQSTWWLSNGWQGRVWAKRSRVQFLLPPKFFSSEPTILKFI